MGLKSSYRISLKRSFNSQFLLTNLWRRRLLSFYLVIKEVTMAVIPSKVLISGHNLRDKKERLDRTRWPD